MLGLIQIPITQEFSQECSVTIPRELGSDRHSQGEIILVHGCLGKGKKFKNWSGYSTL